MEPAARRPPRSSKSEQLRLAKLAAAGLLDRVGPVDRTSDLLTAWGAGAFNDSSDDTAFHGYFTPDVVIDASAAAHSGVAEFKSYAGIEGAKAWFAFVGTLDYEDVVMSHVAGPAVANEVWLRFEAKHISKKTGKSAAYSAITVLSWQGDKCSKVVSVPFLPARTAAILAEEDVPLPPMAALPTFEPHPEPMEAYEKAMALWGSGDLHDPEVFEKYVATDALNDVADSVLPTVLKAYEGSDAVREWLEHMATNWELSNMLVEPVAGLKPGCVTHRFTCDVRHKATGKEAKGVQCYTECAYNTDGQFVYSRHHWVNAPKLASIYSME